MTNWSRLEEDIHKEIKESGWEKPSTIQIKSIPVIIRGRNALLIAPTGSGKTEAALLPIFKLSSTTNSEFKEKRIRILYITPLRALNRDIFHRMINYAGKFGLSIGLRHGDTKQYERRKILENPPDILITTPETLAIMISSPKMKTRFEGLEWVIVDELHELVGNERGSHLCISLERLRELAGKEFVRIGLSATVEDTNEAAKFLCGFERECAILIDSTARKHKVECIHIEGSFSELGNKLTEIIENKLKKERSILVFTNTRDESEFLGSILKNNVKTAPVEIHHGSLSSSVREDVESKLKSGKPIVVITTSSLELGLDIGTVDYVFQIASPRQSSKMIQRIGRSKHQVGASAEGAIIVNRLDDEIETLALIHKSQNGSLEKLEPHIEALDVLVHQIAGLTLERFSLDIKEVIKIVRKTYPFHNIKLEEVIESIKILDSVRIIQINETIIRRTSKTFRYYFGNISMIPDIDKFDVLDSTKRRKVGKLDQIFVGEYCEPGKSFILRGTNWNISSIDDTKKIINVEPLTSTTNTIPQWIGELIPVDYLTAQIVGRFRKELPDNISELNKNRIKETKEILKVIPDENTIVIEKKNGANAIVIHCCFGTKVNQTLSTVLSTILSSKIGFLVEVKTDPYRILLVSQSALSTSMVSEIIKEEIDIENVLSVAILGTHPLNWKTWHVAKRFGIVDKESKYDRRASRLIQNRFANTSLQKEVVRELFLERYAIDDLKEIIKRINNEKIKVVPIDVNEFTPLAKPILDNMSGFASLPNNVEQSVVELVKERLLNTKHRLVCLSCGWERITRTEDVSDGFRCPQCKSKILGISFHGDNEIALIVKKKKAGKKIDKQEEQKFRKAWRTASFYQRFGRTALVVLSGHGIGPETASRILKGYLEEDEVFRSIYRAEKIYAATRGFWQE